jgi:hypothetical protein
MADSRCFIQFSHPGREHEPERGGVKTWNKNSRSHKRKFLQFVGEWIEPDARRRTGGMRGWGEWEPESDLIRELHQPGGDPQYPRYLWLPYYITKDDYLGLHNTDPFIFGERFLYSNCGQASKPGLTHLGDGSVIAFGSGKKIKGERRWMLDTVLVVKDSVEYRSPEILKVLDEWAPDAFLLETGGLLTDSGRLYRGATPDDPVDGMFSFFPAIPAGGDSGFPRPLIDLPSKYFNPLSWQSPKGLWHDRTAEELRGLWDSLVSQVRAKGLVIGTHASLPERRARTAAVGI